MPNRITTPNHEWVVAANIPVTDQVAKHAVLRKSVRTGEHLPDGLKVDALETYCQNCRRPYDDVVGQVCEAYVSNEHLIGGTPGERAKRIHIRSGHDCAALGCDVEASTQVRYARA